MSTDKRNNDLVLVHTRSTMSSSEIFEALPDSRYIRLLNEIIYSVVREGDTTRNTYSGLWLTVFGDYHVLSYYANVQSIRPYFPSWERVNHTIYWSGFNPSRLVDAFAEAAGFIGKPEYFDKEGFGFIRFNDKSDIEDLPLLMGMLHFLQPDGSRYDFALERKTRQSE